MDDILFGNNNQATINRLAKRSYRANKQRNVFVTIALFLTAFMITSVFSLGCSYFETYQMQQIRAMGTTADVAITSLSEEQYEELSRSSLVSVVGVSQRLGSIDTSGMDDALLSITWIDETEWQEHRVPTISDIHGDYPQAKNEIMRWRCGMNRKPGYGAKLRANLDPTKGVGRLRQQDGGHGSRNPLRSV